eukprot:m.355386 g.355386  ORF g.355386 m.355386 type:complete len:76 (-) comp17240_c0_seq1:87-314(-)
MQSLLESSSVCLTFKCLAYVLFALCCVFMCTTSFCSCPSLYLIHHCTGNTPYTNSSASPDLTLLFATHDMLAVQG